MVQQRLLEIAIEAFGQDGLDGASTRAIAARAETAMSSIAYHYGGKDGLYLAAADHIAERMRAKLGDAMAVANAVADHDPAAARAAIDGMMAALMRALASTDSEGWSLFITREQMRPTAAFDHIYDGAMGMMLEGLTRLVRVATGADDNRARIAALTLFGQTMVFRSGRASCLRLLDHDRFHPDLQAEVVTQIKFNTAAMLAAMTGDQA